MLKGVLREDLESNRLSTGTFDTRLGVPTATGPENIDPMVRSVIELKIVHVIFILRRWYRWTSSDHSLFSRCPHRWRIHFPSRKLRSDTGPNQMVVEADEHFAIETNSSSPFLTFQVGLCTADTEVALWWKLDLTATDTNQLSSGFNSPHCQAATIWPLLPYPHPPTKPLHVHHHANLRETSPRAGAKLPLTAKEVLAAEELVSNKSQAFGTPSFDCQIPDQIIVMWLVCHSLPWNRIKDHKLDVAFPYTWPGTKLNYLVWAASKAHKLYCNLQEKVISTLSNSNFSYNLPSKITLIHNVWTTKQNRQAFMGILAAYVSENWEFKVTHLGLKYIAWTHKGKFLAIPFANIITKFMLHTKITQTTDFGSNNGTIPVEVDRLMVILRKNKTALALFLTWSLLLKTDDIDGSNQFKEEGTVPLLDGSESDSEASDDKSVITPGERIAAVLKKVNAVVLKITGSAAKQSKYDFWAPKFEEVAPPTLIAGYGI
ncbi:hypothetical protein PSTG_03428 [Puccinia striiformis f. sp. tritici PST-78]|uniref:Uncharacterized protein n=1 Tax=Puccinia striiformis f. sp. tritici PST-78 TaxID=1165861 RepID=A0A0L0VWE2_9BASI|nr:hypothetical protein PSTG_03428 [Puccinia striiformis f. sp. tritici PST-78]